MHSIFPVFLALWSVCNWGGAVSWLLPSFVANVSAYDKPQAPRSTVPAHRERELRNGAEGGHRLIYRSPDGNFFAQVTVGEAEALYLTVYHVGRLNRSAKPVRGLSDIIDITGLMWLPHHDHTLIIATSGLYGKAMLGEWNGGSSIKPLRHVRRPIDECFDLYGASKDGKTIFYGHGGAEDSHPERWPRRSVRIVR